MPTTQESLLEQVRDARERLNRLVEGMDYCLDWKPEDADWSVREVLCHLIDTPKDGLHGVAGAILRDEIQGFDIVADLTNMTPVRQAADLPQLMGEIEAVFSGLEGLVSASSDEDLETKAVPIYFPSRNATETRSAAVLIGGSLERHWGQHLTQIAGLREALGLG